MEVRLQVLGRCNAAPRPRVHGRTENPHDSNAKAGTGKTDPEEQGRGVRGEGSLQGAPYECEKREELQATAPQRDLSAHRLDPLQATLVSNIRTLESTVPGFRHSLACPLDKSRVIQILQYKISSSAKS